jgi:hypothetical protein
MAKEIPLSRGMVAIVDDEDYDFLSQWKWSASHQGYAVRRQGGKIIIMHRALLGYDGKNEIDHINREKWDNRKSNLRIVSHADNNKNRPKTSRNKCGRKGVIYNKQLSKPWVTHITIRDGENNKIHYHVVNYENIDDATVAYDVQALRYFKEFAYTNFPRENYAEMRVWE